MAKARRMATAAAAAAALAASSASATNGAASSTSLRRPRPLAPEGSAAGGDGEAALRGRVRPLEGDEQGHRALGRVADILWHFWGGGNKPKGPPPGPPPPAPPAASDPLPPADDAGGSSSGSGGEGWGWDPAPPAAGDPVPDDSGSSSGGGGGGGWGWNPEPPAPAPPVPAPASTQATSASTGTGATDAPGDATQATQAASTTQAATTTTATTTTTTTDPIQCYPDASAPASSKSCTCSPASQVPEIMHDDWRFATHNDCCAAYGCGLLLAWPPACTLTADAVPAYYDESSVYDSVEACCDDEHAECPTAPPTEGPTASPSGAPTKERECYTTGGDCACVVLGGVPGYIGGDFRGFATYDECCDSDKSSCPTTTTTTTGATEVAAEATAEPATPAPSNSPTPPPTVSPTASPTTSQPTSSPSQAPTPEATGPNGKVFRAYPNIMNGIDECLYDDNWPDWMGMGNNPDSYLFLSLRECCVTNDYQGDECETGDDDAGTTSTEATQLVQEATPEPSKEPTRAPSDPPTDPPSKSPSKEPTDQPSKSPTKSPTPAPSASPTSSPTTSQPTASPSQAPTPEATGPNGQVFRAYPDVMNGHANCLYDDNWPSFMGMGNNPDEYLFLSVEECCAARGYACTDSPTPSPTPDVTPSPTDWTGGEYWYSDIHATGNLCVFGSGYPSWMGLAEYRTNELFDAEDECCARFFGCDDDAVASDGDDVDPAAVTFVDEDFEGGDMGGLPWIQGGTPTHYADWASNAHASSSGTKSIRSGDLNNRRNKSSDLSLRVDSSSGGRVSFKYKASVSWPFERFEVRLDGSLMHMDASASGWDEEDFGVAPGVHTIGFHVVSYADEVDFTRDVDVEQFGDGHVWIDELAFFPTR